MTGPLPPSMRFIDMAGPGGPEVLTPATETASTLPLRMPTQKRHLSR